MKNNVIILSFSSRKAGNCEGIAAFISRIYTSAQVYKLSDFQIQPCGTCQYECFRQRENCPHFDDMEYRLLDDICHSAIAFFIVPNYCDFPCANFFIFNERSQCYFQDRPEQLERYLNVPKKFIVVSNGDQKNFREAFTQHSAEEPEILFLSARKYGKTSIQGDLLDAKEARTDLSAFLGESGGLHFT